MWYRIAQDTDPPIRVVAPPVEQPKSSLTIKEATPEEIEFAKQLIDFKLSDEKSDEELKNIIDAYKEPAVAIKKIAQVLKSFSENIPFENLKPTFFQFATEANNLAENYIKAAIDAEVNNNKSKKDALKQIQDEIGTIPTDLESTIKLIKKLEPKDYYYYGNLIGDFTKIPAPFLIPIKILDYKATWIPKLENDIKKVQEFTGIYNSTNDPKIKKDSRIEIIKGISGILGVISNACIDIGVIIVAIPGLQAVGGSLLALGGVLQVASTLMEPNSPLNYQEIGKLPGKFADAVARVSEGLPLIESTVPETSFTPAKKNNITELSDKIVSDPSIALFEGLEKEYKNFDESNWKNTYGTEKTISVLSQPMNITMKFAKDIFGDKYFWLNNPNNTYYQNFARMLAQTKSIARKLKTIKPQTPSKRSIGYQLVDSAIRNNMTNQFTASLIREMANKYTAGNIYNFLNKKNIEINNLISNEARNANFAARFNVRPGSAGLDSLKVDIMNLKKILNTWK
jgi:hypothetical protein